MGYQYTQAIGTHRLPVHRLLAQTCYWHRHATGTHRLLAQTCYWHRQATSTHTGYQYIQATDTHGVSLVHSILTGTLMSPHLVRPCLVGDAMSGEGMFGG